MAIPVQPETCRRNVPATSLKNIRRDALSDPFRRLVDRVVSQMGVARRRLDVAVAEQLADHRQCLPERQGTRREAVSEVVDPDVFQPGRGPHGPPGMVETAAAVAPVPVVARKNPGAVIPSRQRVQQRHRRRGQLDRAGTGLAVA